jgi:dTDP-4-dehydrorhamnose reductase
MITSGKKALVLGGRGGLLGMALSEKLREKGLEVVDTPRPGKDDYDPEALGAFVDDCAPDFVFNTWAYTQVDKAEDEPYEAQRVNAELPGVISRVASSRNFKLVHYSTDFIFDGDANSPYTESDHPKPMCAYGRTKLSGEAALLSNSPSANLIIIRTAWLFGPGKKNFVSTICGLAREKDRLEIVNDQIGSPTYTPDLAEFTLSLLKNEAYGIFHVVNSGQASWFELAHEAVSLADIDCEIAPITSAEYPQKARRPAYSVLSTQKFERVTYTEPRHWRNALKEYVYHEIGQ